VLIDLRSTHKILDILENAKEEDYETEDTIFYESLRTFSKRKK
jgi:hypothetical protein